jgi:DNA transposition AAA+ family ATPase
MIRPGMKDWFEEIDERDVRRVARMVPASGKIKDADRRAIVETVSEYCRTNSVKHAEVARSIGVNKAYVSLLLRGRFEDVPESTLDDHLRRLNSFVEYHAQAAQRKLVDRVHMTKVAKRLFAVAKNTKVLGCMAAAHGPAGVGKTICAKAVTQEIPGTIYVLVNQGSHTPGLLLGAIYRAARFRRSDVATTFKSVVAFLSGSNRLLILDQAHRLTDKARELVMDLHDAAEIPVLLLATVRIVEQISVDHDPYFGQLSSRVAIRKNLLPEVTSPSRGGSPKTWITIEDVRSIFAREGLKIHPSAARMLALIANDEIGHLRRARNIFAWASEIASSDRNAGGVIGVEQIVKAIHQVDDQDLSHAAVLYECERATAVKGA